MIVDNAVLEFSSLFLSSLLAVMTFVFLYIFMVLYKFVQYEKTFSTLFNNSHLEYYFCLLYTHAFLVMLQFANSVIWQYNVLFIILYLSDVSSM